VLLALFLGALTGWAGAAPDDLVKVYFVTDPPGAEVLWADKPGLGRDYRLLGTSVGPSLDSREPPEPIRLQKDAFRNERETLQFLFRKPGYEEAAVLVPRSWILQHPGGAEVRRWPPGQGVVSLRPRPSHILPHLFLEASYAPWARLLALAFLALLGLAGLLRLRAAAAARQAQKARQWAERIHSQVVPPADGGDPLLERRLGDFWLVERLGRGGMATVYRALKDDTRSPDDQYAVKVINEENLADPEFQRRFRHEMAIYRMLRHPGIVRLESFGEQEGRYYMVLEFVRGETLRDRIPQGGLPLDRAVELLVPLFEAVAFAHSQGVVHRDLKPDNIMVNQDGQVKVMDFGLAKSHDLSRITRTGMVLGTPAYMAPEQIQEGHLSGATDQYALGVVAYELLAGRLPYQAEDPVTLVIKHLMEPPLPLRQFRPDLPEAVEQVVLKMMAKEPADRFADLREAAEALYHAARQRSTRRMAAPGDS
jgi:hypothetical protein